MKKFLELVEENNPEKDIDALTDAKRSLQRLLMKSKIEAHGKAFEDILRVRLDDGRVVELEVKDVQHPVEDQEVMTGPDAYDVDAAVTGLAAKASSGLKGIAAKTLGTKAQEAKSAVKKRGKLAKKAVNVYNKKTKMLGKALKNAAKTM